jgi:nucleotide-binding universal stress UspA family protein
LAAVGCFAAFIGASELESHRFLAPECIVPLLGGLVVILVLVVYQFRAKLPLLTVRTMLTSSIPVAGIGIALFAAAASVAATALTAEVLVGRYSPLHIGLLYLPEVGGAVLTAFLLGIVITRKAMHYLPVVGMISLSAGIAVFRIEVPSSQALALVGSGLTGIGLGATVAPALFVAGFSLPAVNLQRVFAIVELFRAVAAFMIAPIFVHFAATVGGNLDDGTRTALWIGLALAVIGLLFAVGIYALSGARPQKPDIAGFLAGRNPAWYSPPLLAHVRGLTVERPVSAVPAQAAVSNSVATAHVAAELAAAANSTGPVLFAYDGSEVAKLAIERAGAQLVPGRDALVVCAWQPVAVGFVLPNGHVNADEAAEVRAAAKQVADQGAGLAKQAGFHSESIEVEDAPTWQGIVRVAQEHGASLIVIGTHRHTGVAGRLLGSTASEVMRHSLAPVMVVHEPS